MGAWKSAKKRWSSRCRVCTAPRRLRPVYLPSIASKKSCRSGKRKSAPTAMNGWAWASDNAGASRKLLVQTRAVMGVIYLLGHFLGVGLITLGLYRFSADLFDGVDLTLGINIFGIGLLIGVASGILQAIVTQKND